MWSRPFCNPDTLRCQDLCREHADCKEVRFCDADSGICQPGCRDDEGEGGEPNNDFETATVIPLGDANDDGERFGSIDGRVLCDNDEDVLRVDVPPGAESKSMSRSTKARPVLPSMAEAEIVVMIPIARKSFSGPA